MFFECEYTSSYDDYYKVLSWLKDNKISLIEEDYLDSGQNFILYLTFAKEADFDKFYIYWKPKFPDMKFKSRSSNGLGELPLT